MYSTPDPPQQWSVHAEFTINHPGAGNPQNPPKTGAIQDESGVRMLYSWTSNDPPSGKPSSNVARSESGSSNPEKLYGFQKGNLFFTSTPPPKPGGLLNVPVHDSAYGSELFSPGSCVGSNCHPFNRKCRSTCNIILSSNAKRKESIPSGTASHRTQSLRCQTPSACCEQKGDNFYGCGDPWCHHLQYSDDFSSVRRVSPVREICEDITNEGQGNCNELGCAICAQETDPKRSIKRDVSVQTYEMVSKCTSPMLKFPGRENSAESIPSKTGKLKRGRTVGYNRSRQSSRDSFSSIPLKKNSVEQNTMSSQASYKGLQEKKGSESDTKSGDSKKPRTIHIDVYCTGTEIESDSSSSSTSSRSKTVSTPQTVFESKTMYVKHQNAGDKSVPYNLKKSSSNISKNSPYRLSKTNSTSLDKENSDEEDSISTAYPSKVSSYSTIGRSLSSMSSFPNSATPFSMSSCTVPDYESSIGNTSWKDTYSDIDSLLHSRSTIPQNDSLYFVPRKIDEETSSKDSTSKLTNTTNSVHPSDSFEYADSEDRLRIKRMERMWRNRVQHGINTQSKSKLLQQQENLQDIVNKRLSRMNVSRSKDSDSDASDKSEKGWTILKNEENTHTQSQKQPPSDKVPTPPLYKSPSAVIIKERLSLDPSLGAPFTIFPGQYTEPRYIARRFGPVITVFKKPGHHIGPAKNPSCTCDHCRRYFENFGFRNRTCSVGDTPTTPFFNWKGLKKND
ncbi:vitellogenin-1 [Diabrotica virgifera virgifera]|uniref:Uncharacterized protein n=2 Tax=Diabrotica virgifera virgifera TaxID=50390 RepID=A0ABM5KYF9_DIAVI|nr:vitellogenin-1 [Diabrotica virgifera virgifera]XP_050515220.1 vitellogenin-1 [Diabrotica virgifera virgifera]